MLCRSQEASGLNICFFKKYGLDVLSINIQILKLQVIMVNKKRNI